ncbi:unnamed protein product [Eretmochelys imbricata]
MSLFPSFQIKPVYSQIPGFQDLEILELTPGSVVVAHRVALAVPVTARLNATLEDLPRRLAEEIRLAARNQVVCTSSSRALCFNPSSTEVTSRTTAEFNGAEICRQTLPPEFSAHFFPHPTPDGFTCTSLCTGGAPGALGCNAGQCRVSRAGAHCRCPESGRFWYLGASCEVQIDRVGGTLSIVALTAFVLLSGALLLTYRGQRAQQGEGSTVQPTDADLNPGPGHPAPR